MIQNHDLNAPYQYSESCPLHPVYLDILIYIIATSVTGLYHKIFTNVILAIITKPRLVINKFKYCK